MMAFGQPVTAIYDCSKADRILCLDSDFLSALPGSVRYARDYATRRRISEGKQEMCRLYVIESAASITGANADHRWPVRPARIPAIAQAIAAAVGADLPNAAQAETPSWLPALARDFQQHKGASLVIPGDAALPKVHALAHAMNNALGNVGKTVFYTDPIEANSVDQTQSLRDLVADLDSGRVDLLVILGGNPVYTTPIDLKLDFERLSNAKLRVHLSLYRDETSDGCHWHIPE